MKWWVGLVIAILLGAIVGGVIGRLFGELGAIASGSIGFFIGLGIIKLVRRRSEGNGKGI